jgi:hypothetical protein
MDIRNQLIKNSYNYVLQSDLVTGIVYRIGGDVPVNPIFQSGITVEDTFVVENISAVTTNINIYSDILPDSDNTIDLGSDLKRFRDINTVSGTSSYWTSTVKVSTPELDLGYDNSGDLRIINANNSIIQNDILVGGLY